MRWKPKKGNEHRADENLRSRNLPASAVKSVKGRDTTILEEDKAIRQTGDTRKKQSCPKGFKTPLANTQIHTKIV